MRQGPAGQARAQANIGAGQEAFDAFRATAAKIDADGRKFVDDAVAEQRASADSTVRTLLIVGASPSSWASSSRWS